MAQQRYFRFHEFDAARLHNDRLAGVVEPGVYRGYRVSVNAGETNALDITLGFDTESSLMMPNGVVVKEPNDLIGVVRVDNAHRRFSRRDLLVCDYTFTNDPTVEATYLVIRGRTANAVDEVPELPGFNPATQVPIAIIRVGPPDGTTPGSGTVIANLLQTDIIPVPRASEATLSEISSLKPEIDHTNAARIFVQAGTFPNSERTTVVQYSGGYSSEIDVNLLNVDGTPRYFLFAIADDATVSVVADADTPSTLPEFETDVLPLAIAKAVRSVDEAVIQSLTDVRTPIGRSVQPTAEITKYTSMLGESVFRFLRADLFVNEDLIDLVRAGFDNGVGGFTTDADLTFEVDSASSSLLVQYTPATATADALVTTQNLLNGFSAQVKPLTHFMVVVDASFSNVTFDYSVTSATSGFSGARLLPNKIVAVPLQVTAAEKLYLRFFFPAANLNSGEVQRIRSYGVFVNLDSDQINNDTIVGLGIDSVATTIPNLIANGDFRLWSRIDVDGSVPDSAGTDQIDYAYSILDDDITNNEKMFAADGWMFTKREYESSGAVVSRVIHSATDGAIDTALQFVGVTTTGGQRNELEYRVPAIVEWAGARISFAADVQVTAGGRYGLGVVFYERSEDGSLVVQARSEVTSGASTRLVVTSTEFVSETTVAVGFMIVFFGTTTTKTYEVRKAMAAIGSFRALPYTRPANADTLLRQYYERGQAVYATNLESGDPVAFSMQHGSPKFTQLGTLRARVLQDAQYDRSENVQGLAVAATANSVTFDATAITTSPTRLDVDWESEVIYTAGV